MWFSSYVTLPERNPFVSIWFHLWVHWYPVTPLFISIPSCCNGLAGRTSSNALRASLRHCDSSGTWAASLSVCDMGQGTIRVRMSLWLVISGMKLVLNHVNYCKLRYQWSIQLKVTMCVFCSQGFWPLPTWPMLLNREASRIALNQMLFTIFQTTVQQAASLSEIAAVSFLNRKSLWHDGISWRGFL